MVLATKKHRKHKGKNFALAKSLTESATIVSSHLSRFVPFVLFCGQPLPFAGWIDKTSGARLAPRVHALFNLNSAVEAE